MSDRELQEIEIIVEESRQPLSLEDISWAELVIEMEDQEYERAVVAGLLKGRY